MPIRFKPRADISTNIISERLRCPGIPQQSEISRIIHDFYKDFEDCAQKISLSIFFGRSRKGYSPVKLPLLSPIHYLLNEILLRIFFPHTCRNYLQAISPSAPSIASIYSKWPELAISYTDVWSSFHVGLYDPRGQHPSLGRRLDMCLERSRDRRLDLYILYPEPENIP